MNEKINIQDLIDLLAERHGMDRRDADNFVKEFFLLIEESLEKDKYVKIRGLGTFKLIDVESRESVNVNTGERFRIQGHTKVSFTPEPVLKDIINKPFSHFETVVLNDGTVLEDTPLENEDEDDIDTKMTEEKKSADAAEEVVAENETQKLETEEMNGMPQEKETGDAEEERLEDVHANKNVSIQEEENVGNKETVDSSSMKYFIGIVAFVIILCGGAVFYMYYPDFFNSFAPKPIAEETVGQSAVPIADKAKAPDDFEIKETAETVKLDTVERSLVQADNTQNILKEKKTQPVPEKERKKTVIPFEPDSVGYKIVGTETTYTIKEGETLTKVALRFYGTKALWPYLVKHNPEIIKNPDRVPFGTTIKIPKLIKKQ